MVELVIVVVVLLFVPYAIVGAIILAHNGRVKVNKDYKYRPSVSVFLPTFNEEKNIAKKLDNLLAQTYPISEILVFDCSTDNTVKIVKEYQKRMSTIKLIEQKQRIGMARTLNEAFTLANGEIFVKTDCDSISRPNALNELVANFGDHRVGGATGICIAENGVEKYFRKVMTAIQVAETNIDSTLIAHATSLLAFRSSLLEPVSADSLADDTEEFLLIRRKGYRTVIDTAVVSHEEVPSDYMTRRTQKDRRSQGIVKLLLQNITMPFNPKYKKYGAIVLPLEWFILVFSPILLIAFGVLIGLVLYAVHQLLPLAVFSAIGIAAVKRSNFISAIIDTQLSGLMGLVRAFTKRNAQGMWVKAR
ncbi:MAG: cellulose synthase/poly-beta-1,6-N-acetylglucosamine synthase-like glycosyltransferase [Candidatus Nitrosomirales archaeon]|jgi:cellulose synthase/poly-beta-1,6-N-acetylglucosamine synthase-like glycosyltransferase